MPGVLAHSGHWLVNAVYCAPVLVLVAALALDRLRHREGRPRDGDLPRPTLDDVMDGRS